MRLIDADALIEFIENRYEITWDSGTYEGGIKDACTDILEKIDNMENIKPETNSSESPNGWRSCSESPEYDFKDVLIRWHDKRKGCEDEYILCEGYVVRGHWCSIFEDLDVSDYDPIEWMPLSSAYKRGEQDE